MASPLPALGHLRARDGRELRTTNLELFFDLVFVFAITQLSQLLLSDLSWHGAAKTAFLLLVVWWGWIYTTWMTNWFDPDAVRVRIALIACMLASLLMAAAIPSAFGARAGLFAGAYVALQVGRNVFGLLSLPARSAERRMYLRIVVWSVASGCFWIAGALAHGHARWVLWALALAIDYGAPLTMYSVPLLGRTSVADWPIDGGHFAERFELFIIIALGESIVVTGASASELGVHGQVLFAAVAAFASTALLWWLYFDEVAVRARRHISDHDQAGLLGRNAYTYLHLPIVAGIVTAAVGDELLIAHPSRALESAGLLCLVGGPVLYLLGHQAFRYAMIGNVHHKRSLALFALVAWGLLARSADAAIVEAGVAAILVALVTSETHGRLAVERAA